MGWTFVENLVTTTTQLIKFIKTFHLRGIEDLDYILRRICEIESEGTNTQSMMAGDEKKAVKLVRDSMQYKDG